MSLGRWTQVRRAWRRHFALRQRFRAKGGEAAIRRHAGDRNDLRTALRAQLGSQGLALEDQPRCGRNLREPAHRRSLQGHAGRRQIRLHRRRLDPDRRHQGRARRELGGAEGAAGRHLQAEEGHHVSGQARHHGGARADGRRCRVQLVLPPQQPETAGRPERGVQQGRGARPLHRRLLHEQVHVRLALSPGLRLQRVDHAQGGRRRRRRRLEEHQRLRAVHDHRLCRRKLAHLQQAPRLLGQGEDRRSGVQAAVRRQGRLSRHQG